MRIKRMLLIASFILCLSGCSNTSVIDKRNILKEPKKSLYISFTITKEENKKFNMYSYTYDLDSEKVELKAKIEYTSQYPFTAYSAYDNAVYYSKREKKGDQLYKLDLKTKKEEQLTDTIFAINYIIPYKHKVYLVAVLKKERPLGLFTYDKGELDRVYNDKDANVWKVNINPDIDKMVLNVYSSSKEDECVSSGEYLECVTTNAIKLMDLDTNKVEDITKTDNGQMRTIGLNSDGSVLYNINQFYKINKGKVVEENELNELSIYELIYSNNASIYYISNNYELIKYDKESKKKKVIYDVKETKAAMNNAVVLEK